MVFMEDENDEDLTYLTLLNVFISVSKNIYYENRFFCKVILDSKNNRMIQLGFDKIIRRGFTLKIKINGM